MPGSEQLAEALDKLEQKTDVKKHIEEQKPFNELEKQVQAIRRKAEKIAEDKYEVVGELIDEVTEKTDFNNEAAVKRLMRVLKHYGLNEMMDKEGVKEGDTVVIGPLEFDYVE